MKAFISWSGGKDCMLALYSFLQNPDNSAACLVNFCNNSNRTTAHRVGDELFHAQSEALDIPLVRETILPGQEYECRFKESISRLKEEGVTAGIFGDIYLQEHRDWIERVCNDIDIQPLFPLWNRDTTDIYNEFVEKGFRSLIIAVRNEPALAPFIGKELNHEVGRELKCIPGVDICGELGEFHSFVFDGPLFSHPLPIIKGEIYEDEKTIYQPISLK